MSMRPLQIGDRLKTFQHKVTRDRMIEFEYVVWNRGKNSHSDIEAAKADGLSRTIASGQNQMAVVHQLLEQNFQFHYALRFGICRRQTVVAQIIQQIVHADLGSRCRSRLRLAAARIRVNDIAHFAARNLKKVLRIAELYILLRAQLLEHFTHHRGVAQRGS